MQLHQALQLRLVDRAQATLMVATFERLHAQNRIHLSALQVDHVLVSRSPNLFPRTPALPLLGPRQAHAGEDSL